MHRSIQSAVVLGDGLLASELTKMGYSYISRRKDKFEISNLDQYKHVLKKYGTIINCIANTNTYSNEKSHWDVNYRFVINLVDFCLRENVKLIHASTGYVYCENLNNPTEEDIPRFQNTLYSYTKLLADEYIRIKMKNYLIVRSIHKPRPFPFEYAYIDHVGNFSYVDEVAYFIDRANKENILGVYNVGRKISNMFDFASETRIVKPSERPSNMPASICFNCEKYQNAYNHLKK